MGTLVRSACIAAVVSVLTLGLGVGVANAAGAGSVALYDVDPAQSSTATGDQPSMMTKDRG